MNFKRLQHFVTLAEEQHFGRAAERVHLSQSAFSRSIQTLEAETNLVLFDRVGSSVKLTAAGQFLLTKARHILFEANGLEQAIQYYRKAELGHIAFGIGPFPSALLMPQILPKLRIEYPQLTMRIEVHNWQSLVERLVKEDIELFIGDVSSFAGNDDLIIETIGVVNAGFYVRNGHPLIGKQITLEELLPFGIATTRIPQHIRADVANVFGLDSPSLLPIVVETDDFSVLRTMALQTDTVLGVVEGAIQNDIKEGRLVAPSLIEQPQLQSTIGIVSLKGRSRSPAALCIVDAAKREIAPFTIKQAN